MRSTDKRQIFDQEKIHINVIRFQKFGKTFEIVVDPDLAILFKERKEKTEEGLREILKAEKIFSDAKKGEIASPEDIMQVFATKDFFQAAMKMVSEGEIQITSEHREKLREDKRKKIVYLIHRSAINPQTKTPHPIQRIEDAMKEAKVKIDEFKKAEDQVSDIMHKLKPIIPIKFDQVLMSIRMPLKYASKIHSALSGYGRIESELWEADHYYCKMNLPAGLQQDFIDDLNSKTHGTVEITIQKNNN